MFQIKHSQNSMFCWHFFFHEKTTQVKQFKEKKQFFQKEKNNQLSPKMIFAENIVINSNTNEKILFHLQTARKT